MVRPTVFRLYPKDPTSSSTTVPTQEGLRVPLLEKRTGWAEDLRRLKEPPPGGGTRSYGVETQRKPNSGKV